MKTKCSKVFIALMVMTLTLSMMQLTAFATTTDTNTTPVPSVSVTDTAAPSEPYGVEVALYLMESSEDWSYGDIAPKEWSEPKSESVFITEDGTYTVSLTDLQIPADKFMLCYIKDVAAYPKDTTVTHSNVPDNLMVITDVFKVNGSTKKVNDKVRTGLKKGLFDIAYRNDWDDNDNCVDFNQDISSIEITFTVTGITGEPGAIKYEPTKAPTPTVVAAAAVSDTTSDSAKTEAKTAPSTLPIILGGIAAVLVIAVVVIIVVRKKK